MISGTVSSATSTETDVLGAQLPTSRPARGRWRLSAWLGLTAALLLSGAGLAPAADGSSLAQGSTSSQGQRAMWITIGAQHRFAMTLEDNPTARAFAQLLPLSLDMPDLNDNEKHVRLPRSLPTNAVRPGTIGTGDVMLYGNETLVVFYKTFQSNYSYTRIGRITKVEGLVEALGTGTQRIEFAER
jgi:hypothetical protein